MRPRLITPADPHRISRLLPVVTGAVEADLDSVDGVVEDALADLSTARFGKIDPEDVAVATVVPNT